MDLKSNLHRIVDKIDNEQLLRVVYECLKQRTSSREGQIWASLTDEQKNEVYLSYQKSEDDENLISWEEIKQEAK